MRKLLTISFITLLLVACTAIVAHAPVVHAATPTTSAAPAGSNNPINLPSIPDTGGVMGTVMIWIMTLFAWLLGVAAITLDNAVYYTVVTMGNYVHNLAAVGVTWRILRDISNIMLIFGFLAIGISMILGSSKFGFGTKMLPMLLVAAVFLNFSLFISEAIIDVGNLFATEFYTQINGGQPAGAKNFDSVSSITNEGISQEILSQLGLQSIYNSAITNPNSLSNAGATTLIGFMSIILFLIAAFVMFSLAFILIARFIILIFLIIVAPIGFAGLAIPKLSGLAGKWWSELFEQTITAPVLLLMLYIALAVITDAHFLAFGGATGAGAWTGFIPTNGTATNLTGFAGVLLSFIVAMGLLLAVVRYAGSLGAFGASWATKTAGKLSFGATAWGMRQTVGRGANKTAKGLRNTRFATIPIIGTGTVKGLDKVATSSLDVRGSKAWGAGTAALGGKIDAGKAQSGGYRKDLSNKIETRTKYAATLTGGGLTGKEEKTIADAEANNAAAQEQHKTAKEQKAAIQKEQETLQKQIPNQRAEVAKLEQDKQELEASHEALAYADAGVRRADKVLAEATKEKEQKEAEQKAAEEQKTRTQTERDAAAQEVAKQEAEVSRTAEAKAQEERLSPNGMASEDAEQNLKVAQQNLAQSQVTLAAADTRLQQADEELQEKVTASATAKANHSSAEERLDSATNERDIAATATSEKEQKLGTLEQVNGNLTTAKQDLATSESALADAKEKLEQADADVKAKATQADNAKELEEKTKKSMGYKDEGGKKTVSAGYVQGEYAKNLEWRVNPNSKLQWINPAANTEAAKKIKKEAGKSDADRQLDSIKKLIEEASKKEKDAEKPKEEKSEEKPKP